MLLYWIVGRPYLRMCAYKNCFVKIITPNRRLFWAFINPSPLENQKVQFLPRRSFQNSINVVVANEMEHYANNSKKGTVWNFCKKPKQLISKCRRCPQNKSSFSYQATVSSHPLSSGFIHTNQSSQPLTQEMVQQIGQSSLASIFSAMGFSSTSKPSSMW